MSILKYLQALKTWKPSKGLWFRKYTCKIELGPFASWEDSVTVDKPNRSKMQYIFNKEKDEYEVYNTVYTDDLDLLHQLESNYDYKHIYTPIDEKHRKLLKTNHDNRILVRDRLWYNKYRYRIEIYRNWRDTNYTENTLKEAHQFIMKSMIVVYV